MSGVRRSTRLSSVGICKIQTEAPTTPKRRSEIWRLRQPKYKDESEESSSDVETEQLLTTPKLAILKERNDNSSSSSTATKSKLPMDRKSKNNFIIDSSKARKESEVLTPRSSKKRDLHQSYNTREIEEHIDPLDVSPPKLTKRGQPPIPQHVISPTRLLDRLSIDERRSSYSSDNDDDEDNNEDKRDLSKNKKHERIVHPLDGSLTPSPPKSTIRNKYQNARRVLNSAETQNLPGREEQLRELREFFTEHLDNRTSASLYVSGQPGTGKTACLSLLLRSAEFSKRLQCAYINCTSIASVGSIYKKLCIELKISPNGRTERDHLEAIKRHLRKAPRMTLIVLDEIDQLCTSRQSVLYTIFEWPALPDVNLLLVGIANSLDLTDRALMRLNARCELKPRLMHFPSYTKQQIVEIFRSRLEEANVLDVFPPVTLQLLAAKVSAVSGDVRRALDIGRRVVEIAEQQKKAGKREVNINELDLGNEKLLNREEEDVLKPVQVTQVVEVLNKVYGASQNLNEDIEESFPLQQKLMLCTLMLMLRNEKNKDITIGRLHEVYRRVCNRRNICPLDQAEFAGLVDLVETRGILRLVRKKEPRLCKVQLQWDEEEVNAALSDKQLIATILNDTACLRSS